MSPRPRIRVGYLKEIIILSLISFFFLYLAVSGDRPAIPSTGLQTLPANISNSSSATGSSNVSEKVFKPESCTDGWYVTGYFTPDERDYDGEMKTVTVVGLGNAKTAQRSFSEDFLGVVNKEGWGLTKQGDYIGAWSGKYWGPRDFAADSRGSPLVIKSIAVDTSVIPHGKNVMIPTLPKPWNEFIFTATDIGATSVRGNHIDVFTGEGREAEQETFRLTGMNNIVCVGNMN